MVLLLLFSLYITVGHNRRRGRHEGGTSLSHGQQYIPYSNNEILPTGVLCDADGGKEESTVRDGEWRPGDDDRVQLGLWYKPDWSRAMESRRFLSDVTAGTTGA